MRGNWAEISLHAAQSRNTPIKVELPGYRTFETDVTLVAGQKSEVKTNLAAGSIHQADSLINQANNSGQEK